MNFLNTEEFVNSSIKRVEYVSTGVGVIDTTTGGLTKGGVHLIAGATGSGKSLFLLHTAINTALNNKDKLVFYMSFENDASTDKDRLIEALQTYHVEPSDVNNLIFIADAYSRDNNLLINPNSIALRRVKFAQKDDNDIVTLDDLFEIEDCIYFLDGVEYQIGSPTEGAEMFEQGQTLMTAITEGAKKNNSTVICSWQLSRGTAKIKIQDISEDDMSMSIATARIVRTIWGIKKTTSDWQIILIKSRHKLLVEEKKAFTLYDRDHNFNVRCKTPAISKKI